MLLIYFFIGLFVGQFLAVLLCMALFGTGFEETTQLAGSLSHPYARPILYILQFFSAVGGFLAGPLVYVYHYESERLTTLINKRGWAIIPLLLLLLSTLAFMMANSLLIEWNANLVLPETFKTFESWAQQKEAYLQRLTLYLTTFPSALHFVAALLIIALLPALGEELFFRGLMQPLLQRTLGNAHVAIWGTALIFSLFHFQFYGLLPRLFLGALFGYLYYWSGNLLMPIMAHFINNGLSLLLRYLYQLELTELDTTQTVSLSGTSILLFLLVGIGASLAYRYYFVIRRGVVE
ncbi:CPBP family intramembrane glutamic endopeptidase [Cesiribacter andamanensis]|uniref:CPBP family intramembrane glutamic endopeptidase n=1 Tax=Cesiribacter andamanensis TaxID=649507 RepID=UPI0003480363|nr:CPBP family intramembrane glutamic endopeptidase [Cesiribacter andamanensis]